MRRKALKNYGFILFILIILVHGKVVGQEIKVNGGFLKDSAQIGEPVGYYLSASYPQALNVLFPDSVFAFTPFEYNRKSLYPTVTSNGISRDSVVYYLSTFEVQKIQLLSLPIFVTTARDCTTYAPPADSLRLIELVASVPDSVAAPQLPLKTNTLYEKVFSDINYIIAVIVAGSLVIISLLVWIFFGKRIAKHFRLKRLKKAHENFLQLFSDNLQQLNTLFSSEKTEATISLWKKYLEQLERRPYTKLTTRETLQIIPDENLAASLKQVDRAIYGHQTTVAESLTELKKFADERFQKKFEEVKHG
jgi:hypothetical protein